MKESVIRQAFVQKISSISLLEVLSFIPTLGAVLFLTQMFVGPHFLGVDMSQPGLTGLMLVLSLVFVAHYLISRKRISKNTSDDVVLVYIITFVVWCIMAVFVFAPMIF